VSSVQPSEPRPAATVVLFRPGPDGPEILLTQRPTSMAFAAGMHVFPGGAVDAADADPRLASWSARGPADAATAMGDNVSPAEAMALHLAAIRELFEEAGVLLADGPVAGERLAESRRRLLDGTGLADALGGLDVHLRTDLLMPVAHWTTPRWMPRRFSTWFFVADLPAGAEVSFEGDEVMGHRWVSPTRALKQLADGDIEMWIPTSSVVERLVEMGALNATEVGRGLTLERARTPRIVEEDATVVRFAFGAVGGTPGREGSGALHGRREMVFVDPGDPSDDALDAIMETFLRRGGEIRAIVLTATDPDHAAGAEPLARPLGAPILVAPGAGRHLPYETQEVSDGERLPADVDLRVRLGSLGSGRLQIVEASAGE
jgi:8-oxo-dGTP pyrophosphatase MutT (NUDIX family)